MESLSAKKTRMFEICHKTFMDHDIDDNIITVIAEEAGFDKQEGFLLFPGGINEFLEELSRYIDNSLVLDPDITSTTAKIDYLLVARIKHPMRSQQAVKKLVRYLTAPTRLPLATTIVRNSADHIWNLAGDKSTDMNYYSKRMLLMGVYVRATRFYTHDSSEGCIKTEEKITELLANVLKIASVKKVLTAPSRFTSMIKDRLKNL